MGNVHLTGAEPAPKYPTETARYICEVLVPQWQSQFLVKNAGYGESDGDLGVQGEFVEIWRKAKKLKRDVWDDGHIGPETSREVVLDMIGHCFLWLYLDAAKPSRQIVDGDEVILRQDP
jgi:hypothetical protein